MIDQVFTIAQSIVAAFLHAWPYLLLTIPLAVAVKMSGASRYISRAFTGKPVVAVFLATVVGAFSPFCSCGVIPIIAALLIGGVPLAPVMSFWIASPSMDPEAFFLSVAALGWELAVARLVATLILSLGAGLVTYGLQKKGWLGHKNLRTWSTTPMQDVWARLKRSWNSVKQVFAPSQSVHFAVSGATVCSGTTCGTLDDGQSSIKTESGCGSSCSSSTCDEGSNDQDTFWHRLLKETLSATLMVIKFMTLAFLIDALIKLYVPQAWVTGLLGRQNPWAIVTAALLGVPVYASNLTALPMIGGLLSQGMHPAAALAFLIAGPTTTLPAMAAVYGLTSRRVFALYVAFALVGAVVLGYTYNVIMAVF